MAMYGSTIRKLKERMNLSDSQIADVVRVRDGLREDHSICMGYVDVARLYLHYGGDIETLPSRIAGDYGDVVSEGREMTGVSPARERIIDVLLHREPVREQNSCF